MGHLGSPEPTGFGATSDRGVEVAVAIFHGAEPLYLFQVGIRAASVPTDYAGTFHAYGSVRSFGSSRLLRRLLSAVCQ